VLLGRQRELQVIDEVLAAARLGKSSRLIIRGEPGIGKTALLEYAARTRPQCSCYRREGWSSKPICRSRACTNCFGRPSDRSTSCRRFTRLPLRSSLGLGDRIEADRLIVGAAVLGLISAYA